MNTAHEAGVVVAVAAAIAAWRLRRSKSTRPQRGERGPTRTLTAVLEIARREITERLRGKVFRIGTLVTLLAIALAILVPKIGGSTGTPIQTVGVVGQAPPTLKLAVAIAAAASHDRATIVGEPSLVRAKRDLQNGRIALAISGSRTIIAKTTLGSRSSNLDSTFASTLAAYLGEVAAGRGVGIAPTQVARIGLAKPLPIQALERSPTPSTTAATTIGIVFIFVFLSQYCTWILMGVMQEKSSRVVEVLLATVRPLQLLGGKILGIGLVALGQATVIVLFALGVERAAGSDLLSGAQAMFLLAALLWIVLGYAFYCWLFAAAGSMASRQDQVQTLVLPLSIPMIIGYIFSITVAVSGHVNLLFKIAAYVPFTAPFTMPVLVALDQVAWWQLLVSAVISLASTVLAAYGAASIYRRAVLRTGERVRIRQLVGDAGRA